MTQPKSLKVKTDKSKVMKMETKIFKPQNDEDYIQIADILKMGGIIAIPTETVYGLAGNAFDDGCVEKIYKAKGRPSDNPLIVHISEISQWNSLVTKIPQSAMALAEKFWPGPLTIILPKSDVVSDKVSGNLPTVAVRMPKNKIAKKIIDFSFPLAAPSANLSGKPSPTCASHVIADLSGRIDAIVDGGECEKGIESTVITLATEVPKILRPGSITPEMLTEVLGEVEIDDAVYNKLSDEEKASSPGMKYKHYAPSAEVVLIKGEFACYKKYIMENADELSAALCFDEEKDEIPIDSITYGKKDDPSSQAKHIFDALRQIDKMGYKKVFARIPDENGVGLAVFNRLIRAAAFNIIEV